MGHKYKFQLKYLIVQEIQCLVQQVPSIHSSPREFLFFSRAASVLWGVWEIRP